MAELIELVFDVKASSNLSYILRFISKCKCASLCKFVRLFSWLNLAMTIASAVMTQ